MNCSLRATSRTFDYQSHSATPARYAGIFTAKRSGQSEGHGLQLREPAALPATRQAQDEFALYRYLQVEASRYGDLESLATGVFQLRSRSRYS
jgi:hypothetical protein